VTCIRKSVLSSAVLQYDNFVSSKVMIFFWQKTSHLNTKMEADFMFSANLFKINLGVFCRQSHEWTCDARLCRSPWNLPKPPESLIGHRQRIAPLCCCHMQIFMVSGQMSSTRGGGFECLRASNKARQLETGKPHLFHPPFALMGRSFGLFA
jgi:hypothetical protein